MFLAYLTDATGHASDGVMLFAVGATALEAQEKLQAKFVEILPTEDGGYQWEDIVNGEEGDLFLFVEEA